jgi:hypothetical protein
VAEVSELDEIKEIAALLPRRLHGIIDRYVAETPDQLALVEDAAA